MPDTDQEKQNKLIKSHIDKIEAKKQLLEQKGRSMVTEGLAESPEYQKLVEQHRFLRGKQRFLEGSLNAPSSSDDDEPSSSEEALDSLRKQMLKNAMGEHGLPTGYPY